MKLFIREQSWSTIPVFEYSIGVIVCCIAWPLYGTFFFKPCIVHTTIVNIGTGCECNVFCKYFRSVIIIKSFVTHLLCKTADDLGIWQRFSWCINNFIE